MRALKYIIRAIGLVLGLYVIFFAVQTLRPRSLALTLPVDAQPGDVVLMRSHTWRAELVRLIDGVPYRDGFSHVGIVTQRLPDGTWDVIHAVPGSSGTVRREAWPSIARGGGISEAVIYRADLDASEQEDLLSLLTNYAVRAVPFDGAFNHNDDKELYCTELVTTAYAKANHPVVSDRVLAKRAIFPGHLAESDDLRRIASTREGALARN